MDLTDKIWSDLVTNNYKAIYSGIFNTRIRNLSDGINLFTTFVSSASVGGWAVWSHLSGVWGALIAISQFINLAKPYISRIRDFELYHELQLHHQERYFELEQLWFQISLGDLTEEEIKTSYRAMTEKYFNLSKKFLKVTIQYNQKIAKKAEKELLKNLEQYGISK